MLTVLRLRMCSNRCAKPLRPCGSCFEPTSYHIEVVTEAVLESGSAITRRPLGSVHCVYSILGAEIAAGAAASLAMAGEAAASTASALPAARMARYMV